jgi:CO dehydrogenase maturation factor
MKQLVEERTGAPGSYFKLSPKVDDIPEKYSSQYNGIRLLVMGRLKKGGSGCYCGENSLLASLLAHLLVARDEVVVLDMSAGIEHLSRGTARSVDILIIVVEPGRASLETAHRIKKLAAELGIGRLAAVGNKIHNKKEESYIKEALKGVGFLGFIPYDEALTSAELEGKPATEASPEIADAAANVLDKIISGKEAEIGLKN